MVVYQVVLSPQANVGTTNRVYRRKCVMLTICLMVSKERKPSFMRLGLPSCTTYAGTTQGRVILHIYCVQNKPNTWLALGRRRPIIFFFRSSSFVVVKALSLTSMFRLESSVSKKSCLRCTILLRRFSSVGVVNKRKPPTTTFPSTSSISCFHSVLYSDRLLGSFQR